MSKITSLLILLGGLVILPSICLAQLSNFPPPAISGSTITQTISSVTTILGVDGSRIEWTIHPENGNIRCNFGNAYGSTPANPTSSSGYEFVSGRDYSSFPVSVATGIVICTPESGSVTVDIHTDNH